MDLAAIKRLGIRAAFKGADIIRSFYGNLSAIKKKGDINLVTEADIASEKVIIETIRKVFPDHSVLAEESGSDKLASEALWVIDPLDGTTNFAHRVPVFAVSIAFAWKGAIAVGVVLNPMTGELFTATSEEPAQLNGEPITVSGIDKVSESLLATGFPYNLRSIGKELTSRFSRCLYAAQGVRRFGSASLDLCYVACGRYEGYWEQNLYPWDTAAGMLINKRAGGMVTDFSNTPYRMDQRQILATNGNIHEEMLSILDLKEHNEKKEN